MQNVKTRSSNNTGSLSPQSLRIIRETANLSTREAAEILGIHFTTLSGYENGRRKIPEGFGDKLQPILAVAWDRVESYFHAAKWLGPV